MKKIIKRTLITLLFVLLAVALLAGGYIGYMQLQYYRIEDNLQLTVENEQGEVLKPGQEYSALTYNIGFGAYGPDYSFFMDRGVMNDGTPVVGKYGKALSRQSVIDHTNGALQELEFEDADFVLLQEVDVKADRSYDVNQVETIVAALPQYSSVFANNFHSAYLLYPFNDPHGAVEAGLLSLSKMKISEAVRRSYPVDNSFIIKFTDLDRCFAVMRVPVEGGKELVLINSHMSAYDEGGLIRAQQLKLLNDVMTEEYEKGNYVIVGGDFNHALGEEVSTAYMGQQQFPAWISVLNDEDIAQGFSIQKAVNEMAVPTCRAAEMEWEPGVNYATVVDGFIVSDNVKAQAQNEDTQFAYSDHNPVRLTFTLME